MSDPKKQGGEVIADPVAILGKKPSWYERLAVKAIVWHAKRKIRSAQKEGDMKPLSKSVTVWGAVIAGIGGILVLIGNGITAGYIDWGEIFPKVVQIIGLVVAAIGARRAIG